MQRWVGRIALVTGASSGIGAGITTSLLNHGMKVIGCARNIDKLQQLSNDLKVKGQLGCFTPVKCDISNEEDIISMFNRIKKEFGRIDVLVNSAGIAIPAPILSGNTSEWKEMLDVNILGLCTCTRETYKLMKESDVKDGHIVLINSMVGHRVNPGQLHVYAATKHAVSALTEGIRNEVLQSKSSIRVSSVSPGLVETDIWRKILKDSDRAKVFLYKTPSLQPKDIADAVVYILGAPPHVQVHDMFITPMNSRL